MAGRGYRELPPDAPPPRLCLIQKQYPSQVLIFYVLRSILLYRNMDLTYTLKKKKDNLLELLMPKVQRISGVSNKETGFSLSTGFPLLVAVIKMFVFLYYLIKAQFSQKIHFSKISFFQKYRL